VPSRRQVLGDTYIFLRVAAPRDPAVPSDIFPMHAADRIAAIDSSISIRSPACEPT
jgi:hypothetical protein